jgi:hypothetical protein
MMIGGLAIAVGGGIFLLADDKPKAEAQVPTLTPVAAASTQTAPVAVTPTPSPTPVAAKPKEAEVVQSSHSTSGEEFIDVEIANASNLEEGHMMELKVGAGK